MKKIVLLVFILIVTQITFRYLYFYNNGKIAPNYSVFEMVNYLEKVEKEPWNDYIWTKTSFFQEEINMIFRRIPFGGIGNYGNSQTGHYQGHGLFEISDVQLKKYTGFYYFVTIIEIYLIFIFKFSIFRKKEENNTI